MIKNTRPSTHILMATTLLISFLLLACGSNPERLISEIKNGIEVSNITASTETEPVGSIGDAADDTAIWFNERAPSASLILATDKQSGLMIYNLEGDLVQTIPAGRVNNVDLRLNIRINQSFQDIAVASNRTNNTLSFFKIEKDAKVTFIGDFPLNLSEPYGSCMYRAFDDKAHVFVNDKDGRYQQWQLESISPLKLRLEREFSTATQPEGCVAHDASGTLFFGEEALGVWSLDLKTQRSKPILRTQIRDGALVADVEGMDIYAGMGNNYLVVSSQGDNSFAVYELGNLADKFDYQGSFRVVSDHSTGIDGAQETDGLSVSSMKLGSEFPHGLAVIQDGFNRSPKEAQNFKIVDWASIKDALGLEH